MVRLTIYHGHTRRVILERFKEIAPSFEHGNMYSYEFRRIDVPYLIDNGAYKAYRDGSEWDEEHFIDMLEEIPKMPREPRGVILPDIIGDAEGTYERSRKWSNKIDYPQYLATQDGMEFEEALDIAEELDCIGIFVGGTMAWKSRTAQDWVERAHNRDLLCHIARPKSIMWAVEINADSVDTTSFGRNEYYGKLRAIENHPGWSSAGEVSW